MEGRYPPLPVPVTSGSARHRFFRGLSYPYHGLRFLLANPDLWPWAALPFLLTAWGIVGAGWLVFLFTDDLVGWLWETPEGWAAAAWWAAVVGVGLGLFLLAAVVLWVLGNLLASPFYDVMGEKAERHVLGPHDEPFDLRIVLGDAWNSIRHSLLGLLIYVLVMIPLLLLNLIPVAGQVLYTGLSWLATVFFLARELMDVPLSRRRLGFFEKLAWMSDHKALLAGLGTAATLMLAIPFVNFFAMPIAVVGGTLLFCRLSQEGRGVPR